MRGGKEGKELAVDGCRAQECFFRRLRNLHDYEVILWIKIVLARLIDHAYLVELCGRLVGDHLVELPQLERGTVALVLYTDDESGLSSLH